MTEHTVDLSSVPSGAHICFYWNHTSSYYACCIDDVKLFNSTSNYGISTYAVHLSGCSN